MKRIFILMAFVLIILPVNVYGAAVRLIIDNQEIGGLPAPPIIPKI